MNNQAFKQLQAKWYAKLKAKGFEDIEDVSRDDRPLKRWDANLGTNSNTDRSEVALGARKRYYQLATHLLIDYEFTNHVHRRIWELHSQGYSAAVIARLITHMEPRYRSSSVSRIIKNISEEMIKI